MADSLKEAYASSRRDTARFQDDLDRVQAEKSAISRSTQNANDIYVQNAEKARREWNRPAKK